MNFRGVLLQLVEPLYQTLLEPQGWEKFLSMLSRSIEPASIAVHLVDREAEGRVSFQVLPSIPVTITHLRDLRHAEFASPTDGAFYGIRGVIPEGSHRIPV